MLAYFSLYISKQQQIERQPMRSQSINDKSLAYSNIIRSKQREEIFTTVRNNFKKQGADGMVNIYQITFDRIFLMQGDQSTDIPVVNYLFMNKDQIMKNIILKKYHIQKLVKILYQRQQSLKNYKNQRIQYYLVTIISEVFVKMEHFSEQIIEFIQICMEILQSCSSLSLRIIIINTFSALCPWSSLKQIFIKKDFSYLLKQVAEKQILTTPTYYFIYNLACSLHSRQQLEEIFVDFVLDFFRFYFEISWSEQQFANIFSKLIYVNNGLMAGRIVQKFRRYINIIVKRLNSKQYNLIDRCQLLILFTNKDALCEDNGLQVISPSAFIFSEQSLSNLSLQQKKSCQNISRYYRFFKNQGRLGSLRSKNLQIVKQQFQQESAFQINKSNSSIKLINNHSIRKSTTKLRLFSTVSEIAFSNNHRKSIRKTLSACFSQESLLKSSQSSYQIPFTQKSIEIFQSADSQESYFSNYQVQEIDIINHNIQSFTIGFKGEIPRIKSLLVKIQNQCQHSNSFFGTKLINGYRQHQRRSYKNIFKCSICSQNGKIIEGDNHFNNYSIEQSIKIKQQETMKSTIAKLNTSKLRKKLFGFVQNLCQKLRPDLVDSLRARVPLDAIKMINQQLKEDIKIDNRKVLFQLSIALIQCYSPFIKVISQKSGTKSNINNKIYVVREDYQREILFETIKNYLIIAVYPNFLSIINGVIYSNPLLQRLLFQQSQDHEDLKLLLERFNKKQPQQKQQQYVGLIFILVNNRNHYTAQNSWENYLRSFKNSNQLITIEQIVFIKNQESFARDIIINFSFRGIPDKRIYKIYELDLFDEQEINRILIKHHQDRVFIEVCTQSEQQTKIIQEKLEKI